MRKGWSQSKHGVMPQRIAVVAIFVAASNLKDALFEDVAQRVGDVAVMVRVVDCRAQPFGQTDPTVNALE